METSYLLIIIAVFVIIFINKGIIIVRQSEVAMVERLGKFRTELTSGLNWIMPFFDRISQRVDLKLQVLNSVPQPVITKDNVTMNIDAIVFYKITDAFASVYEIGNLSQAIEAITTTTLRDVIGTLELDETLSSRDQINSRLRLSLDDATQNWGVKIERVEVKNIDPPKDIKVAMEQQMRAEREKRSSILEAEGQKTAAILKATGEKESAILKAEGDKEAQILKAQGEALAIERLAAAQAEQINQVYGALNQIGITQEIISLKGVEALTEMAKGENKVFVPFESSSLLANVGAIGDLLQSKKK